MRWATVRTGGGERVGLVVDGVVHLLDEGTRLIDLLGDAGETLAAAARTAERTGETVDLERADLAAPLRPPQIRDFLTFLDHLRNARGTRDLDPVWTEIPAFYFSNAAAVTGPNDPVAISPGCEWFDFELEAVAIIGRAGSNLAPDEAEEHIAGFMVFNDWSARDLQMREMPLSLGPAKGKDGANTLGPVLVTADELAPYRSGTSYHLEMRALVNDDLVGHGWMDQMDWSWGEIISYASRGTTLWPGDAIGSGTVPTGCLLEHFVTPGPGGFPGWLRPGDVVTLEIEHLGVLRQEVLEPGPVTSLRRG